MRGAGCWFATSQAHRSHGHRIELVNGEDALWSGVKCQCNARNSKFIYLQFLLFFFVVATFVISHRSSLYAAEMNARECVLSQPSSSSSLLQMHCATVLDCCVCLCTTQDSHTTARESHIRAVTDNK